MRVQPRSAGKGLRPEINRNRDKETVTDETGAFVFENLSPVAYTVIVSHPEWASKQERDVNVPKEDLTITLSGGGAIGGHVTDKDGKPVAGARVTLQDMPGVPKEAVTDQEGYYQIGGLSTRPIRKKHVIVQPPAGYARPDSVSVEVEEGKLVTVDFTLTASSSITGTVKDSNGNPIEDAKVFVEIIPTEENPVQRYAGIAVTGADGTFEITDIKPNDNIRLRVKRRFYLEWMSDPFPILPGETLSAEAVLKSGSSVSGVVVDAKGDPVAEARVVAV